MPSPCAPANDLLALCSGPVVAMIWEGKNVVATGRKIIGATNPLASEPGTIRGDFAIDVGRNIIHGSDSVESAKREIGLWFQHNEIADYKPTIKPWHAPFARIHLPDLHMLQHCCLGSLPVSSDPGQADAVCAVQGIRVSCSVEAGSGHWQETQAQSAAAHAAGKQLSPTAAHSAVGTVGSTASSWLA